MAKHSRSANFSFLAAHDQIFIELTSSAENLFFSDPNACLIKLRQFGEALAQNIAARIGIEFDDKTTQAELIHLISIELKFDPSIRNLFHTLRIEGNKATHQFKTQHREALAGLNIARNLAIWFHRSFADNTEHFKPTPFTPPADPSAELQNLQAEIDQLKSELQLKDTQLDQNEQLTALIEKEKQEFEHLAFAMDEESQRIAEIAKQHEADLKAQKQAFDQHLKALQLELEQKTAQAQSSAKTKYSQRSSSASQNLELDEQTTRILIDLQLQDAGWEADTELMTYAKGARPEKGRNLAIAEWPIYLDGKQHRADYVLFAGLIPIAVVEAKKTTKNVAGAITQAERYSKAFNNFEGLQPAWSEQGLIQAWTDQTGVQYKIPFLYSCNGRPFFRQAEEQSGTWFRDARLQSESRRALQSFHSPIGLHDQLRMSKTKAQELLSAEPFGYLKLRHYQQHAIEAVEHTLATGVRRALLAMATGTGKTRTIIGLMYRFLKANRFKRILFLVDRRALGKQALDAFNEAPLEQNFTLSKIYNIAELADMQVEAETRIQVATVQAMVQRVFASDQASQIDQYDCIIVDEAHRGYTLDQEMTEGEIATRDTAQYLSSYRRVLDYFDAVKIGLTATPAQHTTDIFGKPVYTYSYREAVADDWLIDHEPPIRYTTLLSKSGIHFDGGETVAAINTRTGHIEVTELEDELDFDVEAFNRNVISENFNQVICQELAKEIDPLGDEKTMIFCVTDAHADMVKRLLDGAFQEVHGQEYNQAAVAKITGQSDKVDQLIRQYKNEKYPSVAITVDLLTTGIDVPRICHLVFLRRVKSRILYEQMIGRATRRCDEIGKTVFKIYDPVDLYATLKDASSMKPLVKDPNITLEQLVAEITDPETLKIALQQPGDESAQTHAHLILNQISQKMMRILRKAEQKASKNPEIQAKLDSLKAQWGVEAKDLPQHLHQMQPEAAAQFLRAQYSILNQLDDIRSMLGSDRMPIISEHADELVGREQSYGKYERPEDYLESFKSFVNAQLNQSVALAVVVNKPKDMTRAQLKEVKLLLDQHGYSEVNLRSAVLKQTHQDIAASIVGHIRRAALGEALIPFEQRVQSGMQKIYALHAWTPIQRKWLDRIAKQLVHEVIIDREFINSNFEGGAKRMDQNLNLQLDTILETLSDAIWVAQSA